MTTANERWRWVRRGMVLLVVALCLTGGATAAGGTPVPYQSDDEGTEEPDSVDEAEDSDGEDSDGEGDDPDGEEPAEDEEADTEPAPEPGEVPVVVWIGAGALVTVAIVWALGIARSD